MTAYVARMLDSQTGNEGQYEFEHRDDLMKGPADDVVAAFFEYADRVLFANQHIQYELNGVIKKPEQGTVVAIGQLNRHEHRDEGDWLPFTLFISKKKK